MRDAVDYTLEDHGVCYTQYFAGTSTVFTQWEECFTGCGTSARTALEDALENAAQGDWIFDEGQEEDLRRQTSEMSTASGEDEEYHYVTLYVK